MSVEGRAKVTRPWGEVRFGHRLVGFAEREVMEQTQRSQLVGCLAITKWQLNLCLLSLQAVEGAHVRTAKANRRARP